MGGCFQAEVSYSDRTEAKKNVCGWGGRQKHSGWINVYVAQEVHASRRYNRKKVSGSHNEGSVCLMRSKLAPAARISPVLNGKIK